MRLPWPFRRQPTPAATATASAPAAWRELEPLPSTVGEAPLTAPTPPFAADLAGAQPLPPVLDQLGHAGGLKAPAGLAVGIARPVVTPAAPAAPVAPPLQRRRRVPGEPVEAAPDLVDTAAADLPPVAPRRPPVVDTAGPQRSFVGLPPDEVRALAHPPGLVGQAQGKSPSANVPAAAETSTPRPEPGIEHRPQTEPEGPPALLAQLRGEGRQRLTLGQARRLGLGLGAPISVTAPAHAGTNDAPSAPLPLPQRAAVSAEAGAGEELPDQREPPPPDADIQRAAQPAQVGAATAESSRPEGARARPGSDAGSESAAARGGRSPVLSDTGGTLPVVARRPIEPLIGARSLRTTARRAPTNAIPPAGSEALEARAGAAPAIGAPADLDELGVRVHRGPAATEMAAALDARAFTHEGEVYLPAAHGPLGAPPARALLAHELTHVAQQRKFGSNLPGEDTTVGRQLEAQARAAEAGGRLPLAARPESATRPAATASTPPAGLGAPIAHGAADERSTGAQHASSTPVAQEGDTLEVSAAALPSAQRAADDAATSPAAAPAGGPAKRSEEELEDLARQLYGKIGLRLRHDLLMERERVGLGVDL